MERRHVDVIAIRFFWTLVLFAYVAVFSTGCGRASILGPDEPHLAFNPPQSEARVAFAEAEWGRQAECVGNSRTQRAPVLVITHPTWFWCGNVAANGCTNFPNSIDVNDKTWEAGLSHELIHWIGLVNGTPPDNAHKGAVWAKCDRLNNGDDNG